MKDISMLCSITSNRLKVNRKLPEGEREALIIRLENVRATGHNLGYGVGDEMDSLLTEYVST
jgi:hypothetical protein